MDVGKIMLLFSSYALYTGMQALLFIKGRSNEVCPGFTAGIELTVIQ